MTPEVLAQHQVVEFGKLRDKFKRWEDTIHNKIPMTEDNYMSIVSVNQTGMMLRFFIFQMDIILEQT